MHRQTRSLAAVPPIDTNFRDPLSVIPGRHSFLPLLFPSPLWHSYTRRVPWVFWKLIFSAPVQFSNYSFSVKKITLVLYTLLHNYKDLTKYFFLVNRCLNVDLNVWYRLSRKVSVPLRKLLKLDITIMSQLNMAHK